MLGIDLTALNSVELRRLLERARDRGQEGLVRQVEAELAARSGRPRTQPAPQPAPTSAPPPVRKRGPAMAVAGLAAFTGAALAWGLTLGLSRPAPPPQPVSLARAEPASRIAVALTTTEHPEEVAAPEAPDAPTHAKPARNPCYDLPTNQERLLCGYPSLAIQDRRMRTALDRARANGSDVKAIEDAQAAWQAGSVNVADRMVLGQRYARRIAELETD